MALEKTKVRADGDGEYPVFSWDSPEYVHHSKSNGWYAAVVVVAVAMAVVLYLSGLLSGVIVTIAGTIALISLSSVHPRTVKCAIYRDGIVVNDRVYRFDEFKSFSLALSELPKVRLVQVGQFGGEVALPLKNVDISQVRIYLKKYLPETEPTGEDLMDMVNRILRF
ncbi:MAG: hypothetical protein WCT32_05435 [Patescibacteria group bacterium]|jgi:hypothetical protein